MTDRARATRLGDRVREVVAEMIETGVKDPRLGFVTITDAKVTPDLREATVYYTVYGDDAAQADTAAALASASGVIRAEIGKQCRLRHVPSLAFRSDDVPNTGRHIAELVEQVRREDAERAAASAGARPAGEADPYRRPADTEVMDDEVVTEDTA